MFKIETDKNRELKSLINGISGINKEVQIKLNNMGLTLETLDASQTTYLKLDIKFFYFRKYNIDKDTNLILNLEILKNILNSTKKKELLEITGDEDKIKIEINSKNKRTYTLIPINQEYVKTKNPKYENTRKVKIPIKTLETITHDVAMVSNYIKIRFIEKEINFKAKNTSIELNHQYFQRFPVKKEKENSYNIEKILEFLKINKITDKVSLQMAQDGPLVLVIENLNIEVKFILAPQVE